LKLIQDEAFRCKGITEKLLDFSRLGPQSREAVDLGELVLGIVDMLGHVARSQAKTIECRTSPAVIVLANAGELKQVALNLVVNALEAVAAEGRVEVVVERRGERARLRVRDDGVGMTAEVREHLFEPFFTRRRSGQGTGLGLSIAARIVADHAGTLAATSEGPERGSEFIMELPVASVARAAGAGHTTGSGAGLVLGESSHQRQSHVQAA
jgi:signal transduction histidine kinase